MNLRFENANMLHMQCLPGGRCVARATMGSMSRFCSPSHAAWLTLRFSCKQRLCKTQGIATSVEQVTFRTSAYNPPESSCILTLHQCHSEHVDHYGMHPCTLYVDHYGMHPCTFSSALSSVDCVQGSCLRGGSPTSSSKGSHIAICSTIRAKVAAAHASGGACGRSLVFELLQPLRALCTNRGQLSRSECGAVRH